MLLNSANGVVEHLITAAHVFYLASSALDQESAALCSASPEWLCRTAVPAVGFALGY